MQKIVKYKSTTIIIIQEENKIAWKQYIESKIWYRNWEEKLVIKCR